MLFDQLYQLGFAAWPGRPTPNQLSWSFSGGSFQPFANSNFQNSELYSQSESISCIQNYVQVLSNFLNQEPCANLTC